MSNEQNTGGLFYIGDEILPSYVLIIISHYNKDPYQTTSTMESKRCKRFSFGGSSSNNTLYTWFLN